MGDIRSIAIYEAQTQGVDVNIVLATIEAETNFTNKTGDQGRSLGPGQGKQCRSREGEST